MFDLNDDYILEGTELESFQNKICEISENTTVIRMETDEIELLPVVDVDVLNKNYISSTTFSGTMRPTSKLLSKDCICFCKIQEGPFFVGMIPNLLVLSREKVLQKGGTEKLFTELREKSKLLIKYDNRMYFTSLKLSESLCDRAGIRGNAVYDTSFERAAFISYRFKTLPQAVNVLVRTIPDTKIHKIMVMASENYQYIPQTILGETIHNLRNYIKEDPQCHHWKVTPFHSEIYLEFPQLAKRLQIEYKLPDFYIPGLCLTTSDTCDASLAALPTWRIGDAIVEGDGISIAHDKKADVSSFDNRIEREIILKFPEFLYRLQNLQGIIIEKSDEVISDVFTKLKIMKAVGKKRTIELIPTGAAKFRNNKCSAYEIVSFILSLPVDQAYPAGPLQKLRRAAYQAAFLDDKYFK